MPEPIHRPAMKNSLAAAFIAIATISCSTTKTEKREMPETPKDVAAAPADAEKTDSGLQHKLLEKGTGTTMPKATDLVTVHYTGWTTDGKLFDSSVQRGQPTSFPLNGVIAGWTEGLQLMVEGESRRFWIPAKMAYGENPPAGYPAGTLVFDVQLIKIGK
jgi:FKBP-type peptidyl-prolyl cis-trans isomerase